MSALTPALPADLFGDIERIEGMTDAEFKKACQGLLKAVKDRQDETAAAVGRMLVLANARYEKADYETFVEDVSKFIERSGSTLWRWRREAEKAMGVPAEAPARGQRRLAPPRVHRGAIDAIPEDPISQGPTVSDAPPATDTDRAGESGVEPEETHAPSGSAAQVPDEGARSAAVAAAPSSVPSQRGTSAAHNPASGTAAAAASLPEPPNSPVGQGPAAPSGGGSDIREDSAPSARGGPATPPVSDAGRGRGTTVPAPSVDLPSFPMRKDIRAIYLYLTSHGEPIHQGVFEDSPDLVRLLHTQIGNVIKAGTNGNGNREVTSYFKGGKR